MPEEEVVEETTSEESPVLHFYVDRVEMVPPPIADIHTVSGESYRTDEGVVTVKPEHVEGLKAFGWTPVNPPDEAEAPKRGKK